jgi:hypothetical protein
MMTTKALPIPRPLEVQQAVGSRRTATMPKRTTLTLTPQALAFLDPIKPALQEFWRTEGSRMKPGEALFQIEKRFGKQIVEELCIPLGFKDFECLLIARAVAEGVDRFDVYL